MSERALTVVVGVPFDVELVASLAEHEWQLAAPPGVEVISRIFRRSAAVGDAVEQLFHLRAMQARRYELTFTLRCRAAGTPLRTEVVAVEARDAAA
jgi:hypothetical protein